jgi:hypothetical protein
MKMKKDFDQARVDEAAAFIAAELRPLLDYANNKSPVYARLREDCPAYHRLTNAESVLARVKALHLAGLAVVADMMKFEHEVDDEDAEALDETLAP